MFIREEEEPEERKQKIKKSNEIHTKKLQNRKQKLKILVPCRTKYLSIQSVFLKAIFEFFRCSISPPLFLSTPTEQGRETHNKQHEQDALSSRYECESKQSEEGKGIEKGGMRRKYERNKRQRIKKKNSAQVDQ
jgi:hypothetical protein